MAFCFLSGLAAIPEPAKHQVPASKECRSKYSRMRAKLRCCPVTQSDVENPNSLPVAILSSSAERSRSSVRGSRASNSVSSCGGAKSTPARYFFNGSKRCAFVLSHRYQRSGSVETRRTFFIGIGIPKSATSGGSSLTQGSSTSSNSPAPVMRSNSLAAVGASTSSCSPIRCSRYGIAPICPNLPKPSRARAPLPACAAPITISKSRELPDNPNNAAANPIFGSERGNGATG